VPVEQADSMEALQDARLELLQVKEDHLRCVHTLPAPERAQAISDFQSWWRPKWDDVNVKLYDRLKKSPQSHGIASSSPGPVSVPGPASVPSSSQVPRPPGRRSSIPPASLSPDRDSNRGKFGLKRIWSRSSRSSSDESANSSV
jgi:hypothetical protein